MLAIELRNRWEATHLEGFEDGHLALGSFADLDLGGRSLVDLNVVISSVRHPAQTSSVDIRLDALHERRNLQL